MRLAPKGSGSWTNLGPRKGWRYRFFVNGKRRSVTAPTQTLARDAAQRVIDAAKDHRVVGTSEQRLADYLEGWLREQDVRLRPRTVDSYRSTSRRIIVPAIGGVSLRDLVHRDVEKMMRLAVERGLAPRSANLARAILSKAMKDAERDGLVAHNPVLLARTLPQHRAPIVPPTPAQLDVLLTATRETRRWPIYVLAVTLGLRQGELLGLSWADVADGRIRVRHTLRRVNAQRFTLDHPKTPSSVRDLPQTPEVARALEVQRGYIAADSLLRGDEYIRLKEDLVFRQRTGAPMNGLQVTKSFSRDLARLGLPHWRFHDLRHACATWLLANGTDVRTIASILGHSSPSTTTAIYAHTTEALMRDALEGMRGDTA